MNHRHRQRIWRAPIAALLVAAMGLPAIALAATDTDRDGLPDAWERDRSRTSATRADTDRDGLADGLEDSDGDHLTNSQEYRSSMNPLRADTDRDGRRDDLEDTDGDGLRTSFEFQSGTSPRRADTDGDGIRDDAEDPDGDGLTNRSEQWLATKPRVADTDGDGWTDGVERRVGTNARDRTSHPPDVDNRLWGLIGNDARHLAVGRQAGIDTRLFEVAWNGYEPGRGAYSSSYIAAKKIELAGLRAAGFQVILSVGIHHPPGWVLARPDSSYVNQYGDVYDDPREGAGRANLIWNPELRVLAATYMDRVFADFGTDFTAVRLGGGRFGELGYPVATWDGHDDTYWAFDGAAAKSNPVPGWRPGSPSRNGEAGRFATWYMDQLVDFQAWQIDTLRRSYPGRIMMLYPSWGIRPTQLATAIAGNLDGSSPAEINGEIARGYDFARQIAALTDPKVTPTTTWLDAPTAGDAGADRRYWSPVHFIASLSDRDTFGENTGQGTRSALQRSADQVIRYGLSGMLWYREDELLSGRYATLDDYRATITSTDP